MNVLPNGFYDDKDKKKARAFLRETKAKLSKLFPNAHGYISYWDDEDFFSLDFKHLNAVFCGYQFNPVTFVKCQQYSL